jgi:hypothetical protein
MLMSPGLPFSNGKHQLPSLTYSSPRLEVKRSVKSMTTAAMCKPVLAIFFYCSGTRLFGKLYLTRRTTRGTNFTATHPNLNIPLRKASLATSQTRVFQFSSVTFLLWIERSFVHTGPVTNVSSMEYTSILSWNKAPPILPCHGM